MTGDRGSCPCRLCSLIIENYSGPQIVISPAVSVLARLQSCLAYVVLLCNAVFGPNKILAAINDYSSDEVGAT